MERIMRSKLLFHSINTCLHCQVPSIGCCHQQIECQLRYHPADSVLKSGWVLNRQQICKIIWIALLSWVYSLQSKFWAQEWDICLYTYLGGPLLISEVWAPSGSPGGTEGVPWGRAISVGVGHQSLSGGSAPGPLRLQCVCYHCSLHIFVPRKLNSPLLSFSGFAPGLFDEVLRFLNCGAHKPSFGHFGHIQGKAHVRLF